MNLKEKRTIIFLLLFIAGSAWSQNLEKISLEVGDGKWWTGVVTHGELMPLNDDYQANMYGNNYGNQIQPLLLSSDGQFIWSEEPLKINFEKGSLKVESIGGELIYSNTNSTLRDAFLNASRKFFPPSGKVPDLDLVRFPQYNTWIELMYNQNQEDILKYANAIINNGFPPGVIMIDDNWQEDYGVWKFHPGRFPAPKQMVDSLHNMGFKVMLWVCPFISADSDIFRQTRASNLILKSKNGNPAIIRWWNGYSALLDFSNPEAVEWFVAKLNKLQSEIGVDGFKFDAGDSEYYKNVVGCNPVSPNEHTALFGKIGLQFPLNEYRAMWKMAGQPLVQRLRDKSHSWDDLPKLIPHIVVQGLMGYSFTCPDMIGGGEFQSFLNAASIDQELVVRSAQIHALMPMMQFSAAPWRILDEEHFSATKMAVKIREKYLDTILRLVNESAETGEPVVRHMEYVFPHQGFANVKDQFMLGNEILVAPVIHQSQKSRKVILPPGRWKDEQNKVFRGPGEFIIDVPLERLPVFEKINDKF